MNNVSSGSFRALKLPAIREHLEARDHEAESNDLSYSEFLSMLLTDELDAKNVPPHQSTVRRHTGKASETTLADVLSQLQSVCQREDDPGSSPVCR